MAMPVMRSAPSRIAPSVTEAMVPSATLIRTSLAQPDGSRA